MLTIFNKNGQMRTAIEPSDNSTQTKEVQGENLLNISFTHYGHIPLDVLDYVDFEGERYWLLEKYAPKQINSQEWSYDLKMYGADSLIKRFLVLETTDGNAEPIFTLTATPREHAQMVLNCINAGMGNSTPWQLGQVDGENLIVIDYNGTYCNEALTKIVEAVGGKTEWWFDAQTLNICRCESGDEITLAYGNGLTELERDTSNIAKFYTRLFPIGSDRNIDPEKYGYFRLMLPEKRKYVEIQTEEYGVFDHFEREAFADIYPRRIGTISEVRSEDVTDENGTPFTIYYFKDDSLDFDPNQHELPNETKRISFQDGDLAGMGETDDHYFECNYNSDTREFELITIWPYDSDTQLPGGNIIPRVGDHYILWNITMPDEYYTLAEQELQQAVNQYNDEHWFDLSVYKGTTDHVWMELGGKNLFLGRRVRLESVKYFPETGFRNSRITKITRKVNLPLQMDIEISDAVHTGTLEQLNGSLSKMEEEVASNGKKAEQYKKEAQDFTVRRFRDTQETIRLLEKAMLANFTSSVSPLSVHTMAALVGDESLQFRFIDNSGNTVLCDIAYSNTTHQLTAPKSILQHLTLGIDTITSDRQSEEYKTWNLEAYTSPAIISETDTDKAFYLYAKVSKTENTGTYLLTDKAVAMEEAVGSYHLLIGILNSEYNGERSFVTLYGFTEILPGRITTDKIVSGDGKTYFDLANSEIGGNIKFKSTSGEYKGIEEGITESIGNLEIGGDNLILNSRCDKEIPVLSTTGGYSIAYTNGDIGLEISDEVLYNGKPTLKLYNGLMDNGELYSGSQRYIQFNKYLRTDNKLEQSDYVASCMIYVPTDYPTYSNVKEENICIWGFNGSSNKYYSTGCDLSKKGQWQKLTVYLPYERDASNDWCFLRIADKNGGDVDAELYRIYIAEIQFVKGNKETTWKPAPEDAQNELKDAIAAEEEARNAALADVSKEMAGLQEQIDGQIESWFESYDPTTINDPAKTWLDTNTEEAHMNDTFTNLETGASWRWGISPQTGTYAWLPIADTATQKALQEAAKAQSTADGKSTTYLSKPTSYSKGDLWILESDTVHTGGKKGEILTANATRSSYVAADWSKKVRYTDDTAALLAQQNAEAAENAAKKAQTDANSANALLSDIANDNKLTPQEKQQAKKEWDAIVAEEPLNEASAKNYGINTTKYTDAYNKLESYLKPLLENLANTSDIKGSDFRNVFNVYYTERTNLLNAISSKAKQLADNAQTKADAANTLATQAKSAATAAQSAIDAMNNDSIFDVTEKQSIRTEWECISGNANTSTTTGGANGSYKKACLMAESYSMEHGELDTQFSSLRTYLSSVQLYTDSNYGDDAGENQFSRTTLATNFANYYNAETALIAEVQKKIVDDVQIGGTNICTGSSTLTIGTGRWAKGNWRNSISNGTMENIDIEEPPMQGIKGGIRFTTTGQIGVCQDKDDGLNDGAIVTMSCWVRSNNACTVVLQPYYNSNNSTNVNKSFSVPGNNIWTYLTWSNPRKYAGSGYAGIAYVYIMTANCIVDVCGIKLEYGNKPTAWSPAPEDTEAAILDAKKAGEDAQAAINTLNNDNVFSIVEKKTIRVEWESISGVANTTTPAGYASANGTYKKTVAATSNTNVSYDALTTAFEALRNQLKAYNLYDGNNTTLSTGFKTVMANKFAAYYDAEVSVMKAIQDAYTNKAIDEIQIGGVNLIDDTDKGSHEKFAGYNGSSVSSGTATVEEFGNITCGTITTSGGTSSLKAFRTIGNTDILMEKSVVLSLYVKNLDTQKKCVIVINGIGNDANSHRSEQTLNAGEAKRVIFVGNHRATYNYFQIQFYAQGYAIDGAISVAIWHIKLEEGNKPTAWSESENDVNNRISELDYLKEALQGTTEIDGGLVLTNLIKLRNQSNKENGGISGLSNDNVAFWSGGTYEEALNQAAGKSETLPVLITKDENGYGTKFGIFKIVEDGIEVSSGSGNSKVLVTSQSVDEVSVIQKPIEINALNEGYSISQNDVIGTKRISPSTTKNKAGQNVYVIYSANLGSIGGNYSASSTKLTITPNVVTMDENVGVGTISNMASVTLGNIYFIVKKNNVVIYESTLLGHNKTYSCIGNNGSNGAELDVNIPSKLDFGKGYGNVNIYLCSNSLSGEVSVTKNKPAGVGTGHYAAASISTDIFQLSFVGIDKYVVMARDGIAIIQRQDAYFIVKNPSDSNLLDIRMKGLPTYSYPGTGRLYQQSGYIRIS